MTLVIKCPSTPWGYECVTRPHPHSGACALRALPLFEVVYLSGGSVYSAGVAEFKQVAEKEADRLRRHRGMNTSVRPYRPKEKA